MAHSPSTATASRRPVGAEVQVTDRAARDHGRDDLVQRLPVVRPKPDRAVDRPRGQEPAVGAVGQSCDAVAMGLLAGRDTLAAGDSVHVRPRPAESRRRPTGRRGSGTGFALGQSDDPSLRPSVKDRSAYRSSLVNPSRPPTATQGSAAVTQYTEASPRRGFGEEVTPVRGEFPPAHVPDADRIVAGELPPESVAVVEEPEPTGGGRLNEHRGIRRARLPEVNPGARAVESEVPAGRVYGHAGLPLAAGGPRTPAQSPACSRSDVPDTNPHVCRATAPRWPTSPHPVRSRVPPRRHLGRRSSRKPGDRASSRTATRSRPVMTR